MYMRRDYPMTDPRNLLGPHPEPDRDPRYGRPYIQVDGRKRTYQRATTLAGILDDRYGLELWGKRMVATGLAERDDLLLAAAAHKADKDKLNSICDKAIEAAKASAGATIGTAVHAFTDQLDRGTLDPATVPASHRKDVEAFAAATAGFEVLGIEVFGVLDDLEVAGTADRVYRRRRDGQIAIGDTKTGDITYGAGKIAIQLGLYSRMKLYDTTTGERFLDMAEWVDQDVGLVVHVPAGTGTCEVYEVDIAAGWESVRLACEVKAWRARKDWIRKVAEQQVAPEVDLLAAAIVNATSLQILTALYRASKDVWNDTHTLIAKARKAELTN